MNIFGLLLIIVGVLLLVLFIPRTQFEQTIWKRYSIRRTHWVPPIGVIFSIIPGWIVIDQINMVLVDKYDIIVFIITLSLLAEGLREAGFFNYAAFYIVKWANGSTLLVVLGLFFLSSVATYITTNDVVVLIFTPLLLTIGYRIGLNYIAPLMLMQFMAANTISAGLYIGSPTNIIVAQAIDISFTEYFWLMLIPTIVLLGTTFILAFLVTWWLISKNYWPASYTVPDETPRIVPLDVFVWCFLFSSLVLGVAIVTHWDYTLITPSVAIFIIGILYYAARSHATKAPTQLRERYPTPLRSFKVLPYEIATFGLSMFVLVDGIINLNVVQKIIKTTLTTVTPSSLNGIITTGIAGVAVNLFNDLPASMFAAEILSAIPNKAAGFDYIIQMTLVGLNIGCYITPIGALAGLLWFHTMRVHSKRLQKSSIEPSKNKKLFLPTFSHLILFGSITFFVIAPTVALLIKWISNIVG